MTSRRLYIEDLSRMAVGRWYALDSYSDIDELEQAIKASNREGAEEFGIADAEGFPSGLIGSYTGYVEAWAWHEAIEGACVEDAFCAFLQAFGTGYFKSAEQAREVFDRIGYDVADTEADFAEECARNEGKLPDDMKNDDIRHYIDWQRYWDANLAFSYTAQRYEETLYFFASNW